MNEAEKNGRDCLATIGKRGELASRREPIRSRAKQMVAIHEAKRAAPKAGKPWPRATSNRSNCSGSPKSCKIALS
jgi:hypothetical protein